MMYINEVKMTTFSLIDPYMTTQLPVSPVKIIKKSETLQETSSLLKSTTAYFLPDSLNNTMYTQKNGKTNRL